MVNYRLRDRKKLAEIIFPILDKYSLLTSKYFSYLKFKEAYRILEDTNITKSQKDNLMFDLIKKVPYPCPYPTVLRAAQLHPSLPNISLPLHRTVLRLEYVIKEGGSEEGEDYISPAWAVVSNRVSNTNDANMVMSKAWLIGFTEAVGSFYLVNKTKDRIVHGFEITKNLDLIILTAIGCILGIKTTGKKTNNTIVTTNSRSIENIIKYYNNTMKGMKSFEFKVWSRSYVKHKGNFTRLNNIRNKISSRKLGTIIRKD